MDTGNIPKHKKTGNIIPIHKGASRGVPKQDQLVALTSHLIEVDEKVIGYYLVPHFEHNNLLNELKSGRSCRNQILVCYEKIIENMQNDTNVDIIHLYFAKAFDKVDFGVSLQKIKK